jgi:hypothetical protein
LAPLLVKMLDEVAPADRAGELRVLRTEPREPMRLVFIAEGQQPASLTLPNDWLYSNRGEADVREELGRLLSRSTLAGAALSGSTPVLQAS